MRCPRCSRPLTPALYEGVTIDRCGSCHGVWLDQGELKPILDSRVVIFDEVTRQRSAQGPIMGIPQEEMQSIEPCPKCSKAMLPMNFGSNSGIIVDVCSGHGMWFDRGELEQIQAIHEHWSDANADPKFRERVSNTLATEQLELHLKAREGIERVLSAFPVLGKLLSQIFKASSS